MSLCDLETGTGRIAQAFGRLKDRLKDVREQWTDDTLRRFEQDHLREIPNRLRLLLSAMEQLNGTLAQAERDCADRTEN